MSVSVYSLPTLPLDDSPDVTLSEEASSPSTPEQMLPSLNKVSCVCFNEQGMLPHGYVKRSSGEWSWCMIVPTGGETIQDNATGRVLENASNYPHEQFISLGITRSALFMEGGAELEKPLSLDRKVVLTRAQFDRIFPDHPQVGDVLVSSKIAADTFARYYCVGQVAG